MGQIFFMSYLRLKFRLRDPPLKRRRGLKSRDCGALLYLHILTQHLFNPKFHLVLLHVWNLTGIGLEMSEWYVMFY